MAYSFSPFVTLFRIYAPYQILFFFSAFCFLAWTYPPVVGLCLTFAVRPFLVIFKLRTFSSQSFTARYSLGRDLLGLELPAFFTSAFFLFSFFLFSCVLSADLILPEWLPPFLVMYGCPPSFVVFLSLPRGAFVPSLCGRRFLASLPL